MFGVYFQISNVLSQGGSELIEDGYLIFSRISFNKKIACDAKRNLRRTILFLFVFHERVNYSVVKLYYGLFPQMT